MINLLLLCLSLVSCDIDGDLAECPYSARLEYWYTGTGQANVLPDYIFRMHEFVFGSVGVLCHKRELSGRKGIAAEVNLPPGRYTLVARGNIDTCSRTVDPVIG
ncbi:MAG: FimB/Mfa2 family fimbrial subunit [Parabacteroides sp.]|nr:FimB/Mfa2 family fimbrial subunit [Parabacteroides sp.]